MKIILSKFLSGFTVFMMVMSMFVGLTPSKANAQPAPSQTSIEILDISPDLPTRCIPVGTEITVSGTATADAPPGQLSQYHVQIDWGDGNTDNITESSPFGVGNAQGVATRTFSASHTFTSTSSKITARIYHQTVPGKDGDADAFDSIAICIITNNPPIADAGPDQTITLPTSSVDLDGSASSDSDGTITSYTWSFVSGPLIINPADTVNSTVFGLLTPGDYIFELTVTDDDGATDTDQVQITVNPEPENPVENTLPLCSDTLDNDNDQLVDLADPDCANFIPKLTVIKEVINDNNGTAVAADFSLIVNATNANPAGQFPGSAVGTVVTLSPGVYGVAESVAPGYTPSFSADCAGSIAIGESKTCTVTNNDILTCEEGYHVVENQCVADSCSDGIQNQDETGVDTGGICAPQECSDQTFTETFVSDTTTMVGVNPAVSLTNVHAAWTAIISGASWIWSTNPVVLIPDPATETEVFTKTFNVDKVNQTITGASLEIAADNSYSVTLNGDPLCSDPSATNFSQATKDTCVITAEQLNHGSNTLEITVINGAHGNNASSNPAGLLYKLSIDGNECVPPPPPEICMDEDADNYNEEGECSYTYCEYNPQILASDEDCVPPPPTDMCVNLPGMQEQVPDGFEAIGDYICYSDYECSDGIDNSDSEDELSDQNDPACHTDGDPNDEDEVDSYDPYDNNETDTTNEEDLPQCSDGIDNDGDGQIDYQSENSDDGCDSADDDDERTPPGSDDDNSGGSSSSGSRVNRGGGQVLGAATDICNVVDTYMRRGYRNNADQVQTLQNFLNAYMQSGLVVDSIYGPKTEAAVKAFQLRQRANIMDPWGLTVPTGIFYLTSLAEAKRIMCPTEFGTLPLHKKEELIPWSKNTPIVPPKGN